jgi:hypothetical protein
LDLRDFVHSLNEKKKIRLALELIKIALPVWDKFADKKNLSYRDSVVWLKHEVGSTLLSEAARAIEDELGKDDINFKPEVNKNLAVYLEKFTDPVIAIEDDDWKLPATAEKIFYSVYNLLSAVLGKDESESGYYLAINQAIDVIDSEKIISDEKTREIINNFM